MSTLQQTPAEVLVDLAEQVMQPRVLVAMHCFGDERDGIAYARLATAMKLQRSPGIALRAIVEGWDLLRINRELW